MRFFFSLLFLLLLFQANSQTSMVYGKVLNEKNQAFFPSANIIVVGERLGAVTNADGSYSIALAANTKYTLRYSYSGYQPIFKDVILKTGEKMEINVVFDKTKMLDTVEIKYVKAPEFDGVVKVLPRNYEYIPSNSGDKVSELIKRFPGVYSNNELSSQYSVRGGNFDENLVYVNGIEVFRPLLIRSGQQEGLNFVNSDMVKSIKFSAGGFDAMYGDKLSSVLDIEYKNPTKFAASSNVSLQGGSIHIEGLAKSYPLKFITGFRYKTNQYILKSIDTKGDYRPSFLDWQAYISYDFSESFQINFLGNYAVNKYLMIPTTRETNFGNIYEALRFTVYFDGQEIDRFRTYMGALTAKYERQKYKLNLTASVYDTKEEENYDIIGQYWLGVLETDMGKDDFGEVAFNKGVGTFINHARNYIYGTIKTIQHRGVYQEKWFWGAEVRNDLFNDKISEWQLMDSAGFSLPHIPDNIGNLNPNYTPSNSLEISNVVKSHNENVISNRFSAYLQRKWTFDSKNGTTYLLNAGLRTNYWDFNKEWLISPRANISIKPKKWKNTEFRIAGGIYSQPPLYREMRNIDGALNEEIKAQKSAQVLIGGEYSFSAWDRPFKLSSELYYKNLWDLIPYEVNDVRIRYFADQKAKGYATGLDIKLFGELVKDAESWVGLSVMKTEEDIIGDYYYDYLNAAGKVIGSASEDKVVVDSTIHHPGYIPRPTDQRINFNLFFQDYIPGYPSFKVHLNLVIGTGLPYGEPNARYKQTRTLPSYRRVDIGFSKQLIDEKTKFKAKNPLRHIKSMWISLNVFNLLDISNTISYIWITDVTGTVYGVPNYLTQRQLNFNLNVKI